MREGVGSVQSILCARGYFNPHPKAQINLFKQNITTVVKQDSEMCVCVYVHSLQLHRQVDDWNL